MPTDTNHIVIAVSIFVAICIVISFVYLFLRFPRAVVLGFGGFLLLQDILVYIIKDYSSITSSAVQSLDEPIILLMLLVSFFKAYSSRNRWYLLIAIFALVAILSSVIARVHFSVAALGLFMSLKPFFLLIIISNTDWSKTNMHRILQYGTIAGMILFIFGLLDFIYPIWQDHFLHRSLQFRSGLPSAQAFFSYPGLYGRIMAVFSLYAIAYFFHVHRRRSLPYLICLIIGMFLSLRLGPPVAIFGTLFVILPLTRPYTRRFVLRSLLAVVILLIPFLGPFYDTLEEKAHLLTLESGPRVILAETSIKIAAENFPFGSGLGTFGGVISTMYYSNVYVQYGLDEIYGLRPTEQGGNALTDMHWAHILGETGVLGFIAYSFIIISILHFLYRSYQHSNDQYIQFLSLGGLMAMLMAIILGVKAPILQGSLNSYLFMLVPGVLYGYDKRQWE